MKLIKDSEARRLFVKFIEGEKGIISIPASDGGWPLMPFKEKACVWFEQTILYIFAQRQHCFDKGVACEQKHIHFLVNIWLGFAEHHTAEYVLSVEKFLNDEVQAVDKSCHAHIFVGRQSVVSGRWNESKSRLLFTFEIDEFPVQEGLLGAIKSVLQRAQSMYNITFPEKRDVVLNTPTANKRFQLTMYVNLYKAKHNLD